MTDQNAYDQKPWNNDKLVPEMIPSEMLLLHQTGANLSCKNSNLEFSPTREIINE